MKTAQHFKYVLSLYFLIISLASFGQFKDEKTYNKAVACSPNGRISIQNKHGNIQISSWQKDSLIVKAIIRAESKSLVKLQESLAETRIDFRQDNSSIRISTLSFSGVVARSINDIKSVAGVSNELRVDYEIKLPIGSEIAVANKYGDIYLDEHEGPLNIELSHGNLRATVLDEVKYLRTNFGNVYIESINSLRGNTLFSEIEITRADRLAFTSKSTEFEIESAADFRISSSNDDININRAEKVSIDGNLSKVNIYKLENACRIDLNYGKVRINKVAKDVCEFDVISTRSTFDLGFQPKTSFKVTGMVEDTPFSSYNSLCRVTTDGLTLEGYYGTKSSATCSYSFNCQKSKIYIR